MPASSDSATETMLGLGLDAGGTQTRWALARPSGEIVGSGQVGGLTGLLLGSAEGRERLQKTLAEIAGAALAIGRPARAVAGMTGADATKGDLAAMIAAPFGIDAKDVSLRGDMDIAYLDAFAPGEGYLVYAGTGSIAAFIDEGGELHRLGGHGGILDDAGSGFWIAAQALRHIWRAEDERPGSFRESALARAVFAAIGGNDWADSRRFVYEGGFEANRGKVGRLALAVAAAAGDEASGDPAARRILAAAGEELARLGRVMTARFGPRKVALAGRVVALHPLIEQSMRAALPATTTLEVRVSEAHHAAARIAARGATPASG
jgi:N-acetylglucosamine kinase-like BadF-type ATPase